MSYSDVLIVFCFNSIIVLTFITTIEFFKQREKIIAKKKQEKNTEQN